MANSDRKRKVLDHLAKSVEQSTFLTPKTGKAVNPPMTEPMSPAPEPVTPPPPIVEVPPSAQADRKRRIMAHIRQSNGDFSDFSAAANANKKKTLDHVRKSLNES